MIEDKVRLNRIVQDLWELVNVPSPTGNERNAAFAFAEMLTRAGASVSIDETLPDSPSIIGRLKGSRPGKVFQLAGHIDHIDVPHASPARDRQTLSGRGSADMKNGLAGILETVRVLSENGVDFPGEVLVTVYGLHEAPVGDGRGLLNLIHGGIKGNAALVAENTHATENTVVLQGKGQSIWNITLRSDKEACHELNRPVNPLDLYEACLAVARALAGHARELSRKAHPYKLLTPESLFVGQMHYGDFYNRVPARCTLQGTRRWHPDKRLADVKKELDAILAGVAMPEGITVSSDWLFVGESYEVDEKDAIVKAQQKAFEQVLGKTAPYAGISAVTDANRLAPIAGVPALLCGFDNEFAHADFEYVRLDRLEASCRIMLLTTLNYLTECVNPKSG